MGHPVCLVGPPGCKLQLTEVTPAMTDYQPTLSAVQPQPPFSRSFTKSRINKEGKKKGEADETNKQ